MDPSVFLKAQARFVRTCRIRLLLLSVALVALWFLSRTVAFSPEENALWERVRNAEEALSAARYGKSGEDPERLGVIGVEWSPISTTLGSLPSKRTAADPFWSVVLFREMARMGLRSGCHVAILASGSFPGFVLNALAAAEAIGCRVLFAASLGASQWGANDPACPWPVMEGIFHRGGFLKTRASWYTLGGEDDTGGGIGDESRLVVPHLRLRQLEPVSRGGEQERGLEVLDAGAQAGDFVDRALREQAVRRQQALSLGAGLIQKTFRLPGLMGFGTQ